MSQGPTQLSAYLKSNKKGTKTSSLISSPKSPGPISERMGFFCGARGKVPVGWEGLGFRV